MLANVLKRKIRMKTHYSSAVVHPMHAFWFCVFCAVASGMPLAVDNDEPRRVKELATRLHLRYVVVTSVTRDDLDDGGAGLFAETVRQLKTLPGVAVENKVKKPEVPSGM